MLREDRETLEMERMIAETAKFRDESKKLRAEEVKFKREAVCYPLFVGAAILTALATIANFMIHK